MKETVVQWELIEVYLQGYLGIFFFFFFFEVGNKASRKLRCLKWILLKTVGWGGAGLVCSAAGPVRVTTGMHCDARAES